MKANPEWVEKWQKDPQSEVAVIVHVHGSPRQYVKAVNEKGLAVVRAFRLTPTIAASGPAACVLDLLDAPWVQKIEPDQKVTTMKEGNR
jgi:hypothetical protein